MAQNQFDVSCGSSGSYINPVTLYLLAGFVAAVCSFVFVVVKLGRGDHTSLNVSG